MVSFSFSFYFFFFFFFSDMFPSSSSFPIQEMVSPRDSFVALFQQIILVEMVFLP